MLLVQTGHDAIAGDLPLAQSRVQEAASIVLGVPDPIGDIYLAGAEAMVLRMTGAAADRIAAAGRRGLDAAETWGLDTFPVVRPPGEHRAWRCASRVTCVAPQR